MTCGLVGSSTTCRCGAPLVDRTAGPITTTACSRSGRVLREALTRHHNTPMTPVHGIATSKDPADIGAF